MEIEHIREALKNVDRAETIRKFKAVIEAVDGGFLLAIALVVDNWHSYIKHEPLLDDKILRVPRRRKGAAR
jgi:hypothetical protein